MSGLSLTLLITGLLLVMAAAGCSWGESAPTVREMPAPAATARPAAPAQPAPGAPVPAATARPAAPAQPAPTTAPASAPRVVVREVPVEVVKEVIKEVPVEVVKEVVREVPVEKVLVKEVVKEVEVVKQVEVAAPAQEYAAQATPAPAPTPAPASAPASAGLPAQTHLAFTHSQGDGGRTRPGATTFRDYQRSQFVETSEDSISTFSLDTDRTSYHLALNWARSGYEVDPDSVRAEEWINAFDYGYAPPRERDSFAVTTDVFKHPLDGGKHLARLGFQAPDLQDDRPLNVTLVLDASGSMADGNRVAIAREAAESIRRSLGGHDRISVVHFTTNVIDQYTVEHRRPDDRDVEWSIGQLAPHDSTNVQAGLDLGVRMADRIRRERPDAHNYIILMSDGVANVDATDPFAILESAYDQDSGNPLRLITIGVGINNYNDYLLEQLAQHGNGWYRYLSTEDQARATFSRDNWLALSVPFADQTRAQVTWDPEVVRSWRMIGYENRVTSDESFTEDRKEFAEIPVGAATTVFYELELTDEAMRSDAEMVRLGDVELRWVTPTSGMSNRQDTAMVARLKTPRLDSTENALLQFGAVVALSSDLYSSLPHIDDRDSVDVRRDLADLVDILQPLGSRLGDVDAYHDFSFVLRHITDALPETARTSGYSR